MTAPGWNHPESPFHPGERAIQARLGVEDRMDRQGRRVIRDFLPQQHREFFSAQRYVLVGSIDAEGQPWASMLVGEPGFLSSPDEHTLRVAAEVPPGDPLSGNLAVGADIGLLGIELPTRRRNRLNGTVTELGKDIWEMRVRQSFGNCPQYIQARTAEPVRSRRPPPVEVLPTRQLGEAQRRLITQADTFFITTAFREDSAGKARGVDVSHRGGRPGFVRIDDARTLTIPDFSGNNHFNTFGNLELDARAGLLFNDFERGDLLYLTGRAEVIWQGEEVDCYPGAERLLRFQLLHGHHAPASLPLTWSAPEFSPYLEATGPWDSSRE